MNTSDLPILFDVVIIPVNWPFDGVYLVIFYFLEYFSFYGKLKENCHFHCKIVSKSYFILFKFNLNDYKTKDLNAKKQRTLFRQYTGYFSDKSTSNSTTEN